MDVGLASPSVFFSSLLFPDASGCGCEELGVVGSTPDAFDSSFATAAGSFTFEFVSFEAAGSADAGLSDGCVEGAVVGALRSRLTEPPGPDPPGRELVPGPILEPPGRPKPREVSAPELFESGLVTSSDFSLDLLSTIWLGGAFRSQPLLTTVIVESTDW